MKKCVVVLSFIFCTFLGKAQTPIGSMDTIATVIGNELMIAQKVGEYVFKSLTQVQFPPIIKFFNMMLLETVWNGRPSNRRRSGLFRLYVIQGSYIGRSWVTPLLPSDPN